MYKRKKIFYGLIECVIIVANVQKKKKIYGLIECVDNMDKCPKNIQRVNKMC